MHSSSCSLYISLQLWLTKSFLKTHILVKVPIILQYRFLSPCTNNGAQIKRTKLPITFQSPEAIYTYCPNKRVGKGHFSRTTNSTSTDTGKIATCDSKVKYQYVSTISNCAQPVLCCCFIHLCGTGDSLKGVICVKTLQTASLQAPPGMRASAI